MTTDTPTRFSQRDITEFISIFRLCQEREIPHLAPFFLARRVAGIPFLDVEIHISEVDPMPYEMTPGERVRRRAARLEETRLAVARGVYDADGQKVAEAILSPPATPCAAGEAWSETCKREMRRQEIADMARLPRLYPADPAREARLRAAFSSSAAQRLRPSLAARLGVAFVRGGVGAALLAVMVAVIILAMAVRR
jgi:hypothetical protein